jgi:hypothetical protein
LLCAGSKSVLARRIASSANPSLKPLLLPLMLRLTPEGTEVDMTKVTGTAAVAMLGAPFLLLAACYAGLPVEFPVFGNPMARALLLAPKSLFTVFRVPFMNLTHGLMAAVMLSCAENFQDARRRASYSGIFLSLLFTVALKSDFEALSMSGLAWSFGRFPPWLTLGAVISVVGGLGLTLIQAQGVPLPWQELRLSKIQTTTLAGLFAVYLAVVTASLLVSHRAHP